MERVMAGAARWSWGIDNFISCGINWRQNDQVKRGTRKIPILTRLIVNLLATDQEQQDNSRKDLISSPGSCPRCVHDLPTCQQRVSEMTSTETSIRQLT